MDRQKPAPSNLEYLIKSGIIPKGTSLEDAVYMLTDPSDCTECIASGQCADRVGRKTGENKETDCLEVVKAYLKQDHKEAKKQ